MISEILKGVIIGGFFGLLGPIIMTLGQYLRGRSAKKERVREISRMKRPEVAQ